MYESPRRRGGLSDAGARVRLESADAHSGTRWDFLRRHAREAGMAAHAGSEAKRDFAAKLLRRTADPRNLRFAWDRIAVRSGETPGVDGRRCSDLDDPEIWALVRTVGKAILDDTYRVAPPREQLIPKTSGQGTRKLLIPTVVDRMVQRAIVQTIQPYLDHLFDANSFGYRPGRDRLHALARAEQLARGADEWVWVTEDLRNAFDNVPQRRLLDVLKLHVPDEGMVRLIERVVVTDKGRGLRQGGNLSPLLLNAYLDHHLDRPWRKQDRQHPLLRVADDLLVLCGAPEAAERIYSDLGEILRPTGMALKWTPKRAIRNLKEGETAEWLGYRLRKGPDGIEAEPEERSWRSLEDKLIRSHYKTAAPLRANETVLGWISQMGPCLPRLDLPTTYARITRLARNQAFDEIPSQEEVREEWERAWDRWEGHRRQMGKR